MNKSNSFELRLPTFARLDEYCDLWCIEPGAANRLIDLFRSMDLRQHAANSAMVGGAAPTTTRTDVPARNGKSIAVLSVSGMMMKQRASMGGTSTVQLRRDLRSAVNDPSVQGILLAIDSPGGTTAGTMALANEVKAANRKKPMWSQIEDSGYSAAYWIASQTSQIFASVPTTGVGSVGTYLSVKTEPATDGQTAATTRVFRSGPLKGIGADGDAITDAQAAHLQAHVDGMQEHFTAAVKSGRGLSKSILDEVVQGGLFLATEAKAKNLIDGIRSIESTIAALAAY